MNKMQRYIMVVLGMHRSGTSVITRGLNVLGVSLGDSMMPPVEGNNAKGFWEDVDINRLNIEMLNSIHSDWCHCSPIELNDVETLRNGGYFQRAVELLCHKTNSVLVFGFKDPRVSKLLPFWKEVFAYCKFNVSYILALRHPLSVVKSLAKRDGLDAKHGYLLWLGHIITSLTESEGNAVVIIDYDRLLKSTDRELKRVSAFSGLEIDPVQLNEYKREFLDAALRHTHYSLNDLILDADCPAIVREIYTVLLDVALEKIKLEDQELQNKIVRWLDEFKRLRSPLALLDKLWIENRESYQLLAERDIRITHLNQTLAERDTRITDLNQTLAERDSQIIRLDDEREHILASTSWKITKPLRISGCFLKKSYLCIRRFFSNYVR
jgi:hypothetical protein